MRLLTGVILIALQLASWPTAAATANEPFTHHERSDEAARLRLIGNGLIEQNAVSVVLQTRRLPPQQRLDRLMQWVFAQQAGEVRIGGEICKHAGSGAEVADLDTTSIAAYPESSWICSPARELVRLAQQHDQLDAIQQRIDAWSDRSADPLPITTLQVLVDIARDDTDAVRDHLNEHFHEARLPRAADAARQRWCDLLILWAAMENPATADLVHADLFSIYPEIGVYHADRRVDVINDYLNLLYRHRQQSPLFSFDSSLPHDPEQNKTFDVFSRFDAATHASSRPLPRYRISNQGAVKVSGHELDYLAFRSPVDGSVEAAAEVATYPGAFTELLAHGVAITPHKNDEFSFGTFSKGNRTARIFPELQSLESHSHVRAASDGEFCDHFFNGRRLLRTSSDTSPAPWIAMRSWRRTRSELRNFRIAGSLNRVSQIELLGDDRLSGWSSYYQPGLGDGLGSWSVTKESEQEDPPYVLVGQPSVAPPGSFDERLLYYVRPLVWDATVTCQFRYLPGDDDADKPSNRQAVQVHPAIGRTVFLLQPDGLYVHRVTNGRTDPTSARPDHAERIPDSAASIPLRTGWNDLQLTLRGDTVHLQVNDIEVGEHAIDPQQLRTFGLFHYADQSMAMVRDIRLQGDWDIDQDRMADSLASTRVMHLDRTAEQLPHQFRYEFRKGLSPTFFDVEGENEAITKTADGIRIYRGQHTGIRTIRLCGMIDGDFDIVAGYKDLEISGGRPTWHCGIGLSINLDNQAYDWCAVNRRRDRMHGASYISFNRKETTRGGRTQWLGGTNLVDQSSAGRLRLARRGTTVYGLHAVGDSDLFRVISEVEVPAGPIAVHGLRLMTEAGKGMYTEATWTQMDVRAESFDPLMPADPIPIIGKLKDLRDAGITELIPMSNENNQEFAVNATSRSPDDRIELDPDGVRVSVTGAERNGRIDLSRAVSLSTNFDIEFDLDVESLGSVRDPAASSEIAITVGLQRPTDDTDPVGGTQEAPQQEERIEIHAATMILRRKADGTLDIRPRVFGSGLGNRAIYLPIRTVPTEIPDQFRIASLERTLYFLYRERDTQQLRTLASYPLERALPPDRIAMHAIGGKGGAEARVKWRSVRLTHDPGPPGTNPPQVP